MSNKDVWWQDNERESDSHIVNRAKMFLERVFTTINDKIVFIVTHSGFLSSVLEAVGRQPYSATNAELVPILIERAGERSQIHSEAIFWIHLIILSDSYVYLIQGISCSTYIGLFVLVGLAQSAMSAEIRFHFLGEPSFGDKRYLSLDGTIRLEDVFPPQPAELVCEVYRKTAHNLFWLSYTKHPNYICPVSILAH